MTTPVWQGEHPLLDLMKTAVVRQDGYVWVKYPDHPTAKSGCMQVHRLVMENRLGRYLTLKEVVHHTDLDKTNNADDNLELCADEAEHGRKHAKQGTLGFCNDIDWPDEDKMLQLLKKMTIGAVARKLGVARNSVVRWCREHNVSDRSVVDGYFRFTDDLCPSKDGLQKLVLENTFPQVADQLEVSLHTLRRWCRDLKIKQKEAGSWSLKNTPNRERLKGLLGISLAEAARFYKVAPETVVRWADELGLSWNPKKGNYSSHVVDEQLFNDYYAEVAAGELSVAKAEILLGIGGNTFRFLCRERNLPSVVGRRGKRARQYSAEELKEKAAKVVAGDTTIREASVDLDCSYTTFKRRCAEHGIELPYNRKVTPSKPRPSRAELQQQLAMGASYRTVARKHGVSTTTCRKWIDHYGLKSKRAIKRNAAKPNKEELQQLIWEKSPPKIARDWGVDRHTVNRWIRKYNITDVPPKGYWRRKENRKPKK